MAVAVAGAVALAVAVVAVAVEVALPDRGSTQDQAKVVAAAAAER